MKHKISPTISTDILPLLIMYADKMGIEIDGVDLDIDSLQNTERRFPFIRFVSLWESIIRQSNDPNFGLHYYLRILYPTLY
jgi:hypothetical protein